MIDIYFAISAILFFIIGFRSGILRTFISIIGIYIAAYFSAGISHPAVSVMSFLGGNNSGIGRTIVFLFLFVLIVVVIEVMLAVTKNIINISLLGPFDTLLGGVLGGVKGLIIAAIICDIILLFPVSKDMTDSISKSNLRPYGEHILRLTYPIASSFFPGVSNFVTKNLTPIAQTIKAPSVEAVSVFVEKSISTAASVSAEAPIIQNTIRRFSP